MKLKKIIIISIITVFVLFLIYIGFMAYETNKLLDNYISVDSVLHVRQREILNNQPEKKHSIENRNKVILLLQKTDSIISNIEKLKTQLLNLSEDKNVINNLTVTEQSALKLKVETEAYKDFLRNEFRNLIKNQPENKINIEDVEVGVKKIKWEEYHFKNMPLAAIYSELDSLKKSIEEAQNEILLQLN